MEKLIIIFQFLLKNDIFINFLIENKKLINKILCEWFSFLSLHRNWSKVNQRRTGNVKGTVKKSLIISFFLYGKQSKTSPVSTGDFSFPVNRGQYLHYQIQHAPAANRILFICKRLRSVIEISILLMMLLARVLLSAHVLLQAYSYRCMQHVQQIKSISIRVVIKMLWCMAHHLFAELCGTQYCRAFGPVDAEKICAIVWLVFKAKMRNRLTVSFANKSV